MTKGHAIHMQQLRKQANVANQPAATTGITIVSLNQSIDKLREENERLKQEKQFLQQRLQELQQKYE